MHMQEAERLGYLNAMDIDSYLPRIVLPGARPSMIVESIVETPTPTPTPAPQQQTIAQLQQELASQKRTPVVRTNVVANVVENIVSKVASTITPSTTAHFQLAIFQPGNDLLLLVPAEHMEAAHLQLLKNILWAIRVRPSTLVPMDNFSWPPRLATTGKVNGDLVNADMDAARETLHSLLEGYQIKNAIQHVLMLGGALAEQLFPAVMFPQQKLASMHLYLLPSLQEMLSDADSKKITWQSIRALRNES